MDELNKDLLDAAEKGELKAVKKCLENGADVRCRGEHGTPLHLAAQGGYTDMASLLISKGADINSQGYDEETPLHSAADRGHTVMAALFISNGADLNMQDNDGWTPLHLAAVGGHTDLAALLISHGAEINCQDEYGKTALDMAEGNAKILLQLIGSGVDVSKASEIANHCNTLEEAQEYIHSLPSAAVTVPSEMTPAGGFKQSNDDLVLPGIVDANEFKLLLKKGTYQSYRNRIYLAGACNVGKSTLASLLIGENIVPEWKSTDGLKILFGRNGINLEERKMVPLDKDKGNTNIFLRVLRGQPEIDKIHPDKKQSHYDIEEGQPEESNYIAKLTNTDTCQKLIMPVSKDVESTLKEVTTEQSMYNVHEKQEIIGEQIKMKEKEKQMQKRLGFTSIHEGIKQELKKGEYRVQIAPSDLVDFGGQKSYDMTHQLFIQGKGTFTLLFDGRKGLHEILAEYPPGNVTTALILKHWVDSILTYCGDDDDDILPVILFVATHKDRLKEDEQLNKMREFQKGLKEMFQYHERTNRIKYDDIFFVNVTDSNDSEVMRLQTTYVDIAFQQKSWGKRMPMAWVPLELQMSQMRENNTSIISKDDLIKINEQNDDLALTNKQVDDFLRVQHLLGQILYFKSQGLDKFIILQPTTLVDILRSFITDKMFFPSDTTLKQILNKMTETGKIRKEDLFKLWKQDVFNKHMPDDNFKEFVAKLLVHLDFLIEPKYYKEGSKSDFYLVPCAVTRKPGTDFSENLGHDKTLCLSYKLVKSSIPSALSFKLIGAAMTIWPLKTTEKGVCLYYKAAIFCIDNLNTLYLLVQNDRVIAYLMNASSEYFISPDIASCVQECLTLTLTHSLEFYHNSFGMTIPKLSIAKLFEIEVVQKCKTEICYLSLTDINMKPPWICSLGREHNTNFPLYWTYKIQHNCRIDCKGLDEQCLKLCPEDKHLARLARYIGIKTFDQFVINLGLSRNDWDRFEYKHQGRDPLMIQHDILCHWKNSADKPSFKDLFRALSEIGYDHHILCQIFREERTILELRDKTLQDIPADKDLLDLSRQIRSCAIHLGVELGLDFCQIEETVFKYKRDMFKQNYDILKKWKKSTSIQNKTIRYLMHILKIVNPGGCKFLKEKYHIVE